MLNQTSKLFLALVWTLLVTFLSTTELDNTVGSSIKIPYKDKYAHFVFYFLFVVLWYNYFKIKESLKNKEIIVVATAILFGIAMEVYQTTFTTTRHGDVLDVIVNSIGALLGLYFVKYLLRNK
ncbi:VanZ family protein [Flavobacterium sp.]|uniref:VanZ family protein n=1 Tax=Flavobacterium sp. TaxID=239 RepID=UPI003752A2CD